MSRAPAPARYCPSCGGPTGPADRTCSYCGAAAVPLGTPDPRHALRCPGCAGLAPTGASFCGCCAHPLVTPAAEPGHLPCPACTGEHQLVSHALSPTDARPGGHRVHGCPRCAGVFVPRQTLNALLAESAQQARLESAATGATPPVRAVARRELSGARAAVVYRSCPDCGQTMARRNFGRISGVVVDVCAPHGTFFDAGELSDVVAFVETGGLLVAQAHRDRERRDLATSRARTGSMPMTGAGGAFGGPTALTGDSNVPDILDELGVITATFIRFSRRWIKDRLGPS